VTANTLTAEDRERIEREDRALADQLERAPLAGAKAIIATLAKRHQIEIRIAQIMPDGAHAYALPAQRAVGLPPLTALSKVSEELAVALHEFGHVLIPACTRKAPHLQDRVSGNGCCFQCEVNSWEKSMALWPFSESMFRTLGEYLRRSATTMTSTAQGIEAADKLVSRKTFEAYVAARADYQRRLEQLRAVEVSIHADAATSGAFPCSSQGCTRRSAMVFDERAFCVNCGADRQIASQKAWARRLQSGHTTLTLKAATSIHQGIVRQCLADSVRAGQRACTTPRCRRTAVALITDTTWLCSPCHSAHVDAAVRATLAKASEMKAKASRAPRPPQATSPNPAAERRRLLKENFTVWQADVSRSAHAVEARDAAARARREAMR